MSETVPSSLSTADHILELLNSGKPLEALQLAEASARENTSDAQTHFIHARCLAVIGRHRESFTAVEKALALEPDFKDARNLAAELSVSLSAPQPGSGGQQLSEREWRSAIPGNLLTSIQRGTMNYSYKGVPLLKNPFDLAIYPLLIWNTRPRTIIEIGSKDGGSGLWFAEMLDSQEVDGHIHSIDIVKVEGVTHRRLTFYGGDGRDLASTLPPDKLASLRRPWLIIDDADHAYETSIAILRFFHPHLRKGEYIVVEDGIITDMCGEDAPLSGPHQALEEFLGEHGDLYEIDNYYCDFFGSNVTWNSNGYLRRSG